MTSGEMRIAYFDTISGISGDMTLGAFVSAGLPLDELIEEVRKLNLTGVELEASHIQRSGITAVKIDVIISAKQTHHRGLKDIVAVIDASALSDGVKSSAKKIVQCVAEAEAKVHNVSVDKIHFHEVGALDSIVDIVGAAICLEKFSIKQVYSSPVKLGSGGFIGAEHGNLPLPGPAALEILKGYPIILTDIPFELTTPTGGSTGQSREKTVRLMMRNYGFIVTHPLGKNHIWSTEGPDARLRLLNNLASLSFAKSQHPA